MEKSSLPQKMKRCRRYNIPGHAHFLTFSCFLGQSFLSGNQARGWLTESIESARMKHPFDLWAFVFMPDHVHLLVLPHQGVDISIILKHIKQPVAVRAVQHVKKHAPDFLPKMRDVRPNGGFSHRFWQRGGGYDRNLWNLSDIKEKIDYIHKNPVRGGLVTTPAEWYWSSFNAWETGRELPIRIDRGSLPDGDV